MQDFFVEYIILLAYLIEKFNQFVVSYEDFCKNPGLLNDPKLVIKINERYVLVSQNMQSINE